MLFFLDNLLRDLFKAEVRALRPSPILPVTDDQIGIRPPDDTWRTHVSGLGTIGALNIYLIELRENRALRTNDRLRRVSNGTTFEEAAPARIDCHYLITAWYPGQEDQIVGALDVGKTVQENELLYQVASVLLRRPSLVPREVYSPNPLPPGFPPRFADSELPTTVLPVEGFPKYAEFWGTMGQVHPWKPGIYLVVTLPVTFAEHSIGGIVTSLTVDYGQGHDVTTAEGLVSLGGSVLDATKPLPGGAASPVADAWVRLETTAGVNVGTTTTDASGHFLFDRLKPGPYRLRWRDGVRPEPAPKPIHVPGSTPEYQLVFV